MTGNDRARLVFHGAIVVAIGLLCGFPAGTESATQPLQPWRTAHLGLIVTGIWLMVTAAVLPALVLARREASALAWSLIATAYGFMTAALLEAITGVRGRQPGGSAANWVAFIGNSVGGLSALLAAGLTLLGARAALKGGGAGSAGSRAA